MNASPSVSHDPIAHGTGSAEMIDTAREMLTRLDTFTIAGQHHVMEKLIGFAELQIARAARRSGPASRRVLWEQLECLRSEANHIVPNVPGFTRRAESLMALLTMLA